MANARVEPLGNEQIKEATSKDKDYTLSDGNGLQLVIKTDGRKIWEIRYTVDGKAKKTTGGNYPIVSIDEARLKRDLFKSKVAEGIDPIQEKKELKRIMNAKKDEAIALEASQIHLVTYKWLSTHKCAEGTTVRRKRAFERDLFPHWCEYDKFHHVTASKRMGDITHGELMRIITDKGIGTPETANRLFADCVRLWTYAVSHDYIDINITHKIDKSNIPKQEKKNYAKITDPKMLGELMRAIDTYQGNGVIVRNLLRFVALIPLRADNVCGLKWDYVDFDNNFITIPRHEMKTKNKNLPDFKMPLPLQAVAILKEVHKFTGWGVWVFHSLRDIHQSISRESANKALRVMGFTDEAKGRKQTLHSFRGTFRSLSETYATQHKASFEVREMCLDHHEKRESVRAYTHRADYTEQMLPLLQWWADYLDGVKSH